MASSCAARALVWIAFAGVAVAQHAPVSQFSGASALDATRKVSALGARPVDTESHRRMEAIIVRAVRGYGCAVEEQSFTAETPAGPRRLKNIIARVVGRTSEGTVALSGHYDTKPVEGHNFIGANDGGSSTGFLMEMARVLCGRPRRTDVLLVWLDGEEAVRNWTEQDSLYGSRYLADLWVRNGTAARIRALINVDMIGDGDLGLVNEANSTPWLRELVWETARELGHGRHFSAAEEMAIEDDHIPFLQAGIAAVDLIDFSYGPGNSWWHTEQDTVDKLSASSFQVVGSVLMKVLAQLENRKAI